MAAPARRRGPPPLTVSTAAPPQGGGAIRGIGESLSPDEFGGGAGLVVPLPFPDARGASPALALTYQSGGGNGAFGSGVDIGLLAITRQTAKRIPRYRDTDVFIHATFGELVPIPDSEATLTVAEITYRTRGYRQRLEGAFASIEHWHAAARDCWRLVDHANVTWLFGVDAEARITDPADPARIFSWLLQESVDAKGNHILYHYRPEDDVGAVPTVDTAGRSVGANRYLARIDWGNQAPLAESMLLTLDVAALAALAWHFHAVFDYGEYDTGAANPYRPVGDWRERADRFSHYAAGFEIRTTRLCRTVMIFHDFPAELGSEPLLVTAVRLGYDENPYLSLLTLVAEVGFRTDARVAGGTRVASPLPPLELGYAGFDPTGGAYRDVVLTGGAPVATEAFEWVDLYGAGIPGLLQSGNDGVRFWEPSAVDPAAAHVTYAGPKPVAPVPIGVYRDGGLTLADVIGAGRPQWCSRDPRCPGYAEIGMDGAAGPFHVFESVASDQANPARHVVNVTGSGLPDLLMIAADRVEYTPSLGARGYAETRVVPSNGLPPAVPDQPGEARRFVDIFGSGQLHYVRIRNGSVTCWPNLGYGRFGAPVELANAPWLDGAFDPARLYFADLDGTGPVDLLYLASDGLRLYRNRAGNGFDDAMPLPLPGSVDALTRLDIVDLLGAGVPCLVVTRPSPLLRQSYLAINHGVVPYRLTSVINNRGREATLAYTTSAQAWLADRNRGLAWLTVPPMPVPLLAQIVDTDALSDTVTTRRFTYRHGYYDADERVLVGFAFVEESDAEAFPDPGIVASAAAFAYAAPPCVTRRWRDTGAAPGAVPLASQLAVEYFTGDAHAYAMPASTAQFVERDAAAVRQARYAARGQILREEVYGADGTAWAAFPYTVDAHRYRVSQVQPSVDGQASVFFVQPLEAITYDYERNPGDPQVAHDVTLAVDAFGNVTDQVSIAYPRRSASPAGPGQTALLVTRTRATYLNVTTPFRALGVVSEETVDELSGLVADPDGYLGVAALIAQLSNAHAARFDWRRYHYAPDPGGAAFAPQQLPIRIEQVAFDRAALTTAFAPALDAAALAALLTAATPAGGGYTAPTSGDAAAFWWSPGNTLDFTDAAGFYRARASTDPFGVTTTCTDDPYGLFVTGMTDVLDNVVTVEAIDYQALQPARIRDPSGALFEAGFDANGLVVVTSAHGSEGGTPAGFATLANYAWPMPPLSIAAVLAAPADYLQGAASAFAYAMLGWCGGVDQEAFVGVGADPAGLWADLVARGYISPDGVILARFRRDQASGGLTVAPAYRDDAAAAMAILAGIPQRAPAAALALTATGFPGTTVAPIAATIAYTDGFSRILQIKTLADEPQPTIGRDRDRLVVVPATTNWLTSGAVRYNAKGDPMRQFDPFFSATGAFDPLEIAAADGLATTFHYDAIGRLVQTDLPIGTMRLTIHGAVTPDGIVTPSAWACADYDENDALKQSPYYQAVMADPAADPYEKAAVEQAALAEGSPVRTVFDPLGRAVRTIAQNDGLVTVAGLETLCYDAVQATTLLSDLVEAGYLDERGAPTVAFTPEVIGWTLVLPAPFADEATRVGDYILGVQRAGTPVATELTLDIRGNPVRIADQRLAAAGMANATITYSLADIAVLTDSADAGPRWQLANAAGSLIFTQDGNANVVKFSYDQRQRVARRQLSTGDGTTVQLTMALYGDSARATTPGGALQPYFATPERWNLRGQPVASFDSAGLIVSPFASFQRFPLAHRRWVRADAATLPDWEVADDAALAALATAITVLADPAALPTLKLPDAVQPQLDRSSFDGTITYDPLGRQISATDADGNATVTTFNARGLAVAVAFTPEGDAAVEGATTIGPIEYDAHTQPRAVGVAGAFVTRLDYDPRTFHLVGIETRSDATPAPSDAVRQAVRYYRDPVGNVMFALDQAASPTGEPVGAQPTQRFTYDLLYRLITATGREAAGGSSPVRYAEHYMQDDSGNVTGVTHQGGTGDWSRSLTIAATSNRLVSAAAIGAAPATETFGYDANGNQTTLAGLDAIEWTYLNRIGASNSIAAADGSFTREDHVYSGTGQRVQTVRTTYPALGQPATRTEEITYADTMEITRVRDGDRSAPVVAEWHVTPLAAGALTPAQWLRWLSGAPASQPIAAMRYPLVDIVGSVRQVLGPDGAPLSWRDYLPFGADAFAWAASDTDAALQRRRYAGQEQDANGGLYGYDARHYALQLMRWLSPDPGGMTDTLNLYQFVRGNPATCTDADGRITIHHWNVKDKNTPALQNIKFIKEFAVLLNGADDKRGSVVFVTEVMGSVSAASFNNFLSAVNHHSSGGWTGRVIDAGVSEGGWRREKIGILTKGVTVENYFQLVAEHATSVSTEKETHPTGNFTKQHAFNERQIIGVDISTNIGGMTDTLSIGSYHNQGPSTGAMNRAGRARGQAKKHRLHAVIGDWNVEPDVHNQEHPAKRRRTRGSGAGEEVTFDRAPTSKGKKLYDYTMSFNSEVGDRTLMVKNTSGSRGKSSDHRQNSATLTTRKRKIDD